MVKFVLVFGRIVLYINTTEQGSGALTVVFPNPNPEAWLNGLRFGSITQRPWCYHEEGRNTAKDECMALWS